MNYREKYQRSTIKLLHVFHRQLAHLKFVAWYLFGPGALSFFCLVSEPGRSEPGALLLFCLVSEPGWCGPGTLFFLCLVSGPRTVGQVYLSGQGLSGPGIHFFFAWYLSQVGVSQVVSFFFAWYLSQVGVGQVRFFFFAWYLGPDTRCASWRWKTCSATPFFICCFLARERVSVLTNFLPHNFKLNIFLLFEAWECVKFFDTKFPSHWALRQTCLEKERSCFVLIKGVGWRGGGVAAK